MRRDEQHLGKLFLFGCLVPLEANPAPLFLDPKFVPAFAASPVALIEKGVRDG
jgi:hypothetical protein